MRHIYFFLFLLLLAFPSFGQFTIKGKVTDAETGDPIPFASVLVLGSEVGISTDFDGNYLIEIEELQDSIRASYLGYQAQTKTLEEIPSQILNFQLKPSDLELSTFVFESGENPAYRIIREAVSRRKDFDKRQLSAYQTKNYTKIEIDVDNISSDLTKRRTVQKVTAILDSIKQLRNDEGEKILPVFFSETISKFYYRSDPTLKKEVVEKTKVTGIGISEGSTTSQITGSAFQEYNFYRNWLTILEKDFISPLAEGWKGSYDYDLLDSVLVGQDSCYLIQVIPLRKQDLAFTGRIWINKQSYALKQVDLTIPKEVNLNFIDRIKIQQELTPTSSGPLIPQKTRVQIKIAQLTGNSAGMLAKFYTSSDSIQVGEPEPASFFNQSIVLERGFNQSDASYWKLNRQDSLNSDELAVLNMVDTLKRIPIVRFFSEGMKFFATGYLRLGKFEAGPWPGFFSYNDVEGIRLGMGGRTNLRFSEKWFLQAYLGYGFRDKRFKYSGSATRILDRVHWTTLTLKSQREIDQVGLEIESLEGNSVFLAASRLGTLRRPYLGTIHELNFQREFFKGFLFSAGIGVRKFDPLYDFFFVREGTDEFRSDFQTTEASLGIRYGRDELIIINDNERVSFGPRKWPVVELNVRKGLKTLAGELAYTKINLNLSQRVNVGKLGISRYDLEAGKVIGEVPYPILKNHLGNETWFYTSAAFNTMDFNEFASDQYVSLRYRHSFEGLLLNRIPVLKVLKWRAVANGNILWGSVNDFNVTNAPTLDPDGNPLQTFGRLDPKVPYLELGYGIENIFRVFRVDFFHRMTYLDNVGAKPFHVKVSAQIIL